MNILNKVLIMKVGKYLKENHGFNDPEVVARFTERFDYSEKIVDSIINDRYPVLLSCHINDLAAFTGVDPNMLIELMELGNPDVPADNMFPSKIAYDTVREIEFKSINDILAGKGPVSDLDVYALTTRYKPFGFIGGLSTDYPNLLCESRSPAPENDTELRQLFDKVKQFHREQNSPDIKLGYKGLQSLFEDPEFKEEYINGIRDRIQARFKMRAGVLNPIRGVLEIKELNELLLDPIKIREAAADINLEDVYPKADQETEVPGVVRPAVYDTFIEAFTPFYKVEIYPNIEALHEQLFLVKEGWVPGGLIGPTTFTVGVTTYKTVKEPDGSMVIELWSNGKIKGKIVYGNGFTVTNTDFGSSCYYSLLLTRRDIIASILFDNY